MTPLRQRFIDDLRLKNFSDGTIKVYVHAVEKFALFLRRSPHESTAEDVRAFLIHELDRGISRSYCVIQLGRPQASVSGHAGTNRRATGGAASQTRTAAAGGAQP